MTTPTQEQMEKLKHATGWGRCLTQIGLEPGWRDHFFGRDADCDDMCDEGWMFCYSTNAYRVTKSGLALVLAEWATVTKFDVLTVIDTEDRPREEHTTRVVAKTHAAARFKIARSIQDAWSCDFVEAVRHIKSVRKVRP